MDIPHRCIDVTEPPFSAAGDGVTDDAKAFQAAVNAITNGTVRFPSDEDSCRVNDGSVDDASAP